MTTGEPATPWQRLDTRVLAVHPVIDLAKLLPLLVVIAVTGGSGDDRWRLGLSGAAAVAVLLHGASRWFTTSYRLTGDRVELRTGLLRRRHRSVRRDRIRTADLTATPVHRVLGLSVIRVGTGSREAGDDHELALDAVGRDEAERLRTVLLGGAVVPGGEAPAAPPEVARLRWAWVRFAPLTFSALAVVGAVWVALFRVVEEFGWRPDRVVRSAATSGQAPVWLGAAALLLTAVVGAVVVFAEGWWGYRLTRADDGGVVLRRGLLTRRTLSLEGRRIRGVEIDEPLVLRLGRGARPMALTTGLPGPRSAGHGEHVGALSPAVPRAEALRIAAETIATPAATTTAAVLDRHPRAARTRRLVRGLAPAIVLVGVVALAPWPGEVRVLLAVVLLVAATALACDRWRALGHRLTDRHLVARHGSWLRRTVVVDRAGVIGWELSQGLTQRRTGLVTVSAVTAAGRGAYVVPDVAVDRGVAVVDATTPGLLAPFLVRPAQSARVLTRR